MAQLKNWILLMLAATLLTQAVICKSDEDAAPSTDDDGADTSDSEIPEDHDFDEYASPMDDVPANEYMTQEEFLKEYDDPKTDYAEVIVTREFFPTKKTTIDRETFKKMLKRFTDGSIHGVGLDFTPEEKEEGETQLQELIQRFVDEELKDNQEFTILDFYKSFMGGEFYEWMEKIHPELQDQELEGEDKDL